MTGEDLGYKPSVIEQAKFDYSSLGKIFTKGLDKDDKDDKKEGLFKRMNNIEDNIEGKYKEQSKPIKNQLSTVDKKAIEVVLQKIG